MYFIGKHVGSEADGHIWGGLKYGFHLLSSSSEADFTAESIWVSPGEAWAAGLKAPAPRMEGCWEGVYSIL